MKSRPLRGSSVLPKRRGPCDAACGRGVPGTTSDAQPVLPVKRTHSTRHVRPHGRVLGDRRCAGAIPCQT